MNFFETKIRPVLVENCYGCHSAEAAEAGKLRGGLLLDSREAARRGGESGPAVVPGDLDESLLISALRHESFEMPPKGKLPDTVIANFVAWIEMGAPDPRDGKPVVVDRDLDLDAGRQFWSFQPLIRIPPPEDESGWSQTAIDRFVIARQHAVGLRPNPPAKAQILVRRAWFDLLGLPPSPEEMQTWVARLMAPHADGSEGGRAANDNTGSVSGSRAINRQAWASLVDHLLASPHYGQRWARHWMDVARFAESHGYEQDYDRPHAYHYRDFLIRAFNDDLPYDQFVRWQLAGDELAPENPLAWMATGFLGAGPFPTQLTEAEFESARYDELDDMVATTGVAFLGLSVGCARCHDHKFDPIPSVDYYRLAACFTTAIRSEKEFDLQPEANAARRQAYQQQLSELQAELERFERDVLPVRFRQWLAHYDSSSPAGAVWEVLEGELQTKHGTRLVRQEDGSYLATGPTPAQEVVTFRARTGHKGIAAIRLEALMHDSLPQNGPGRADNGNFVLSDFQVAISSVTTSSPGDSPVPIPLASAKTTHQQNDNSLSVAASIDEDPISGWAVDGQIGRDQAAIFVPQQPFELADHQQLMVKMSFRHPNTKHALGRFRLSVTSQPDVVPVVGDGGPDARIICALARLKESGDSQSADWRMALDWFKTTLPGWQSRRQALTELQQTGPQTTLTKVMVTSEGLPPLPHHADGRGFPHFYPETHFLRRGDVHQKGEVVRPGYLQVFLRDGVDPSHWRVEPAAERSGTSFRRASLANWMTDAEHGAGHLAARVIVNRLWQHHFGRGLVATPNDFGASGERPTHPELLDWLAAELLDNGWRLKQLHKQIMTSSVYLQSSEYDESRATIDRENHLLWRRTPRRLEAEAIRDTMLAVSGLLDTTMYGPGTLDETMRRRSIYFFIKRSQLIPMMMLFDWPEHLVSIGQRASTTTAPQALLFMNGPQARQYAEAWAGRLQELPGDEAVRQAYWQAFGRAPDDRELRLAVEFLEQQSAARRTAGQADSDRLALADLCQTLMSMNEFIYID